MPNDVVVLANRKSTLSVVVTCGVTQAFDFDPGTTLADVRRRATDVLNVPPNAKALVCSSGSKNFVPQDEGYVLQENDAVQYQKPSGEKG